MGPPQHLCCSLQIAVSCTDISPRLQSPVAKSTELLKLTLAVQIAVSLLDFIVHPL